MARSIETPRDATGREIDIGPITGLLDCIERAWDPVGVWLFGSRARGEAVKTSDWDLLIVTADDTAGIDDPLNGYRLRKETGVRADVLMCRATDFQEDRNTPNTIAYEAAHGGVLLYGR